MRLSWDSKSRDIWNLFSKNLKIRASLNFFLSGFKNSKNTKQFTSLELFRFLGFECKGNFWIFVLSLEFF